MQRQSTSVEVNSPSFDLDVNNYTVKELMAMFKMQGGEMSLTRGDIVDAVENMIFDYKALMQRDADDAYDDDYIAFFRRARHKLLKQVVISTNETALHMLDRENVPSDLEGGVRHVIAPKSAPTQNAVIYEYPKGSINPVERRTMKRVINIDTLFRPNYERTRSNNFVWTLHTPINNVVSMQIMSAQIPNMWLTFSSERQNNQFVIYTFNVNDGSGNYYDSSYNVVIPEGNYSPLEFQTLLNNYFKNVGGGLSYLKAEIDSATMRTVIRANDARMAGGGGDSSPFPYHGDPSGNAYYSPEFYFILDFALSSDLHSCVPLSSPVLNTMVPCKGGTCTRSVAGLRARPLHFNAGWMMGFRNEVYLVRSTCTHLDLANSHVVGGITYNGYIASESSYGSAVPRYAFIEIDDYNRNFTTDTIMSSTGSAYIGKNIVARIPLTASQFGGITNDNPGDHIFKQRDYFGPIKLEKMTIRIIDKYGVPFDLLDNDYSLAIELTTLY
jgi:hypothetical protein